MADNGGSGLSLEDVLNKLAKWRAVLAGWQQRAGPVQTSAKHDAATAELRTALHQADADYAKAGNADGKFWSPFKETVRQVQQTVHQAPGITTREPLVGSIRHHYSTDRTARSTLLRWLWLGKIPGVRGEGERPVRWFPAKKAVGAVAHG